MAEIKTKRRTASVNAFLESIKDQTRRKDCHTIVKLMKQATNAEPAMWGPSIVGFGTYHYKYESGREGDWFLTGFSPRQQALTLYIMSGFKRYDTLMKKLGTHKTGKSCLYIKRLADVDLAVLEELIQQSVKHIAKAHA